MDHELSAELMNFEMLYYSHYFFKKETGFLRIWNYNFYFLR